MIAAGIAGFAYAVPAGSIPLILACAVLQGGGFGIAWPFVTRMIVAAAPESERTIASSAVPTMQRIGYAVGAALTRHRRQCQRLLGRPERRDGGERRQMAVPGLRAARHRRLPRGDQEFARDADATDSAKKSAATRPGSICGLSQQVVAQ